MTHHLIALAGFATREHAAIESAFGTAALKRLNCRVTNQLGAAALVIADGDNVSVIRLLRARRAGQQVLLIGHSDGGSGWPTLPRRFRMADLVAALSTGLAAAASAAPAKPEPEAFAATEPFAPLAQESPAPTRKAIKRAFAATEPFAPLAQEPRAPTRQAPGHAFAATEPFAPLAGEAASFAATEPFAPLSGGQPAGGAQPRREESRRIARDDAITPESMAAFKRAQDARARAASGQTDFMGIAAPSGFGEAPQSASTQVLVVDDSEIGLRLLHRHLLDLGAGVKLARSGSEALQAIATERFSHVLVDSMMSGMAGLKTCRAIKNLALPEGRMPKVVLVTNMGGSSDRAKGMLAGCDAYLLKPFQIDDLRAAMSGLTPAA